MKSGSGGHGDRLQRNSVGRHPAHRGTIAFLITSDEEGSIWVDDGYAPRSRMLRERSRRASIGAWSVSRRARPHSATPSRSAGAAH